MWSAVHSELSDFDLPTSQIKEFLSHIYHRMWPLDNCWRVNCCKVGTHLCVWTLNGWVKHGQVGSLTSSTHKTNAQFPTSQIHELACDFPEHDRVARKGLEYSNHDFDVSDYVLLTLSKCSLANSFYLLLRLMLRWKDGHFCAILQSNDYALPATIDLIYSTAAVSKANWSTFGKSERQTVV